MGAQLLVSLSINCWLSLVEDRGAQPPMYDNARVLIQLSMMSSANIETQKQEIEGNAWKDGRLFMALVHYNYNFRLHLKHEDA